MKRFFSVLLCLCLLLGSVTALAEGSVTLIKSNVTDVDPPEIISVTLEEDKQTLKPGDVLHVQLQVDDRSAVGNVYGQFYNEAKDSYITFNLSYDARSDMFTGERALVKGMANGTYLLNWLSATDKYGNNTGTYNVSGMASFTLTGAGVKATVTFKEKGATVTPDDPLHITVKLKTALPDAANVYALISNQEENRTTWWHPLNKQSDTLFKGEILLSDKTGGTYELTGITFEDENYNEIGRVNLTGQTFTLINDLGDNDVPVIHSAVIKEKGKTLGAGSKVHISAKITDDTGISWAWASLQDVNSFGRWNDESGISNNRSKNSLGIDLKYNDSTGKYEGILELPKDMPDGKYSLYVDADDNFGHYTYTSFPKQYISYKSPDYVDNGMKAFITTCWSAVYGKKPTASQIETYGTPLATGKSKAVNVIRTIMKKAKLSNTKAAKALWKIMQGTSPNTTQRSKTVKALKKSLDYAIDSLNDASFRQRCSEWGIQPGNLGTEALDINVTSTEVTSVDVNNGRYILKGSEASLSGVTSKSIKKLVIPATVKANGKTYNVTGVEWAACRGLTKLTTLTIGKNVTSIAADAFANCKKLATITINGTKLKTAGAECFSGIKATAVFKCPESKLAKYKKLFKNKIPEGATFAAK